MSNIFSSVQVPKVGTNWFNLSHDTKLSLDMGKLVPVMCAECLPGEKWRMSSQAMVRFAPLVAPVMHRFHVYFHYFFVPNRILWENWNNYIFDVEAETFPTMAVGSSRTEVGSLSDYLGLPSIAGGTPTMFVNPMPFAAYQAIYSEFFRDQNLIPEVNWKLVNGAQPDPVVLSELLPLRTRAWRKDYFSSALPFAQRGSDVMIPLSGNLEVTGFLGLTPPMEEGPVSINAIAEGVVDDQGNLFNITHGLQTENLDQAQLPTVREFRQVLKLQEWLERNARGGVRAREALMAHFGVKNKDARMQIPEYVYSSRSPVVVSEVLQTAEGANDPVGNMAGHGISVGNSRQASYYTPEHGYMMCLMSVMPEPAYQQGIPRHFLKGAQLDRFSYAWPTFQHIGEQEILNSELYVDHLSPNETFGYTPRYAEYKYIPSTVHGDFRTTLNHWHDGRIFSTDPALNQEFVECVPDKRIFAVQEGHCIWAQVMHNVSVRRPLAKFGNPKL